MKDTRLDDAAWGPAHLWEDYTPTPLLELPALARRAQVARVFVKIEAERPLGNFKVLGGMFAGLRAVARAVGAASLQDLREAPRGSLPRLICASDGNHGLAVAAAAARAGTSAAVYLPADVSLARTRRIEAFGAQVVRIDGTYDDAVRAASEAAARGEGLLVADTSADTQDAVVRDVMDGYAVIAQELVVQFRDQVGDCPSHGFVQAGVGGLAAAMADGLADFMQATGRWLTVEPESAACVARALAAGRPVPTPGELHTRATMLSCGLASAPALDILRRRGVRAVVVGEDALRQAPQALREAGGPETTVSGAAGLAGLLQVAADPVLRQTHQLDGHSIVLLLVTEGPVDD